MCHGATFAAIAQSLLWLGNQPFLSGATSYCSGQQTQLCQSFNEWTMCNQCLQLELFDWFFQIGWMLLLFFLIFDLSLARGWRGLIYLHCQGLIVWPLSGRWRMLRCFDTFRNFVIVAKCFIIYSHCFFWPPVYGPRFRVHSPGSTVHRDEPWAFACFVAGMAGRRELW